MEFSRQEYWSGLPFLSPGDLPNPGFEPRSPTLQADTLPLVQLFGTLWTAAHQAPLSMGFSRQEYWSELPCPPPGDLSHPGIKPLSLHCRQILYHLSHQWKWKLITRVWLFATVLQLYSPWNSPGQNTGVGSLSLLQGIFLTPESNWGLPHCRQILYQLSYQRRPWATLVALL